MAHQWRPIKFGAMAKYGRRIHGFSSSQGVPNGKNGASFLDGLCTQISLGKGHNWMDKTEGMGQSLLLGREERGNPLIVTEFVGAAKSKRCSRFPCENWRNFLMNLCASDQKHKLFAKKAKLKFI